MVLCGLENPRNTSPIVELDSMRRKCWRGMFLPYMAKCEFQPHSGNHVCPQGDNTCCRSRTNPSKEECENLFMDCVCMYTFPLYTWAGHKWECSGLIFPSQRPPGALGREMKPVLNCIWHKEQISNSFCSRSSQAKEHLLNIITKSVISTRRERDSHTQTDAEVIEAVGSRIMSTLNK